MNIVNRASGKPATLIVIFLSIVILLSSCGGKNNESNLRNQYSNDMESYVGWNGISGYYSIKSGDAHSGQHSCQTDTSFIYSLTFSAKIKELSDKPIKKVNMSVWLKCLSIPANGSYILSIEQGDEVLKYFPFQLKESDAVVNEWVKVSGTAEFPVDQSKDAIVKIYFWNKSKSIILVDDMDFEIEN
ncbi:hypothetical protein BH11BAC1_BH11BAC1_12450 [soil metagenome]